MRRLLLLSSVALAGVGPLGAAEAASPFRRPARVIGISTATDTRNMTALIEFVAGGP